MPGHGDDVETDNAYVQGNAVQITPQIAGTVLMIGADDTDFVRAGQTLLRLDPADTQVALEQAEAQLAQTVREVRQLFANNGTLSAQLSLRQAELTRLQSEAARARDDVRRRSALIADGAIGREEFEHAKTQLATAESAITAARAAVEAARAQLGSNRSLTDRTRVETHPNVLRAALRVHEAWLARHRVDLPAPVDGYVARRSAQLGQRVQAGAPLMSVIPLNTLWVDANFKESQLGRLRIGQRASLSADVYGTRVRYHGRVLGLGAGTGAAFALLPQQNATGNWIKIVQRVPVRIALLPDELAAHPLRLGLSMVVSVDVGDSSGSALAEAPRPLASTAVFDTGEREAEATVRQIIADNSSSAPGEMATGRHATGPAQGHPHQ
ncbi:HlyD family efflux transporter periplasmic adaptor subunit [Paucibacter sp. R3-3]|uniref:HlyD family efflux transporter periplasmic adaptor subunit n=2 Tax=Roseateles agri TaxID=3098619 RepID=A0ABU5DT49_9BURK|nr:HlyD family efflux transporter periplasmic adaptor subunit [Paucibacter sp. R3-3]MDY0749041.1 HlyD family efflux transporter periplasmic adaptor subunit [Paucibacter sp. R3-3]